MNSRTVLSSTRTTRCSDQPFCGVNSSTSTDQSSSMGPAYPLRR
ncbi:MAG: hypothetical protein ACR2J4_08155 [Deinococcus sp.]